MSTALSRKSKSPKGISILEGMNEKETQMILDGNIPKENLEEVCRKLKMFEPKHVDYFLPTISRNLKAIILRDM